MFPKNVNEKKSHIKQTNYIRATSNNNGMDIFSKQEDAKIVTYFCCSCDISSDADGWSRTDQTTSFVKDTAAADVGVDTTRTLSKTHKNKKLSKRAKQNTQWH